MRCPACTTTVDDFKTLRLDVDPAVVQAVVGGRKPTRKAKDVREVAGGQGEDDGKPVLLRFDNASWVRPSSTHSPKPSTRRKMKKLTVSLLLPLLH